MKAPLKLPVFRAYQYRPRGDGRRFDIWLADWTRLVAGPDTVLRHRNG